MALQTYFIEIMVLVIKGLFTLYQGWVVFEPVSEKIGFLSSWVELETASHFDNVKLETEGVDKL